MATGSQDDLCQGLETLFGLRNTRADWIRRQTAFSADELKDTICRTDICTITNGTLPWNIHAGHSVPLGVKVLAQIEDIINIGKSDPRCNERPRIMQMTLNDGMSDFVAVELQPWGGRISLRTVAGSKLILQATARVYRGRLLLRAADFMLLGGLAVSGNVWGVDYDAHVAEARRKAGIPDANARTLEGVLQGEGGLDVVWTGDFDDALPLNIGGIANPSLLVDEADGSGQDETNGPWGVSTPSVMTNTPTSGTMVANRVSAPDTAEGNTASNMDNSSRNEVSGVNIPEVPESESDAEAGSAMQMDSGHNGGECMTADWTQMLQVPQAPLTRLATLSTQQTTGALVSRIYTPRMEQNGSMEMDEDTMQIRVTVDDGSKLQIVRLAPALVHELTQEVVDTASGTQVRQNLRKLSGFASLTMGQDGDLVMTELTAVPRGNVDDFLKAYGDNIEARLAKFFVEGGVHSGVNCEVRLHSQ